jgi:hypothetical protein
MPLELLFVGRSMLEEVVLSRSVIPRVEVLVPLLVLEVLPPEEEYPRVLLYLDGRNVLPLFMPGLSGAFVQVPPLP